MLSRTIKAAAVVALVSFYLQGCASQAPKAQQAQEPAVGAVDSPAVAKIEASKEMVYLGYKAKSQVSLLEVLKASGKKVAIFQFAGAECLSCQDEAREIEAKLSASAKGKDIVHIVVLTDFFKDYEASEFKAFMDKYAPKATAVYDEAKIWKKYSKNPASPSRATIMALNLDEEVAIFKEDGEQHGIVTAAEGLVK